MSIKNWITRSVMNNGSLSPTFDNLTINGGLQEGFLAASTDTTLTASDVGKVIMVGGGPTITIPNLWPGATFKIFINAGVFGSSNNSAFLDFPDNYLYHTGIGLINGTGISPSFGATYKIVGNLRAVTIKQDNGDNWNIIEDNDIASFGPLSIPEVLTTNSATLTGTTAGTITSSMPEQGVAKKFVAYANGYENDTTTNQTITFPTPFSNPPIITSNTTGLSLTVSNTELTITSPDNTTAYSGVIIVEGI